MTRVFADEPQPSRKPTEPRDEGAKIGFPKYDGVWQPTGPQFEVMFRYCDPIGSFHIRERERQRDDSNT